MHVVVVDELEVEDAVSELFLRQTVGELVPCFAFGSDTFHNLCSETAYDFLILDNIDDISAFGFAILKVVEFSQALIFCGDVHSINTTLYLSIGYHQNQQQFINTS